jgi:hypothetical protein
MNTGGQRYRYAGAAHSPEGVVMTVKITKTFYNLNEATVIEVEAGTPEEAAADMNMTIDELDKVEVEQN